ncbi:MAG: hypothetical protein Q8Q05_03945 [bacterium]|nr:hypothetical protein [bacterium]
MNELREQAMGAMATFIDKMECGRGAMAMCTLLSLSISNVLLEDPDGSKYRAMMNNISRITKEMLRLCDSTDMRIFNQTVSSAHKDEEVVWSDVMDPRRHGLGELLAMVRNDLHIQLAPFYFDIDKHGHAIRAH